MVRFSYYAGGSVLLTAAVIFYAYYTKSQFYNVVIYLVTSKFSIMTLGNMALVFTLLVGRITKKIFLGTLRDAEVETLYENSRYAVTETCLALTIFREEINLRVVALFTALLFTKIFHWLCQSRVEHVEQSEIVSRLTHFRILALMGCLASVDAAFIVMCSFMTSGPSVLILFGFEFLVLFVTLLSIFLRYILHVIDLRADGTWTNKSTYVFYLELATEVVRLFIYLIFFMIIFSYYGMPLHIVRDLWVSIKNLERRISAYFRYRRLTANMNERFPNATEQELSETDRVCIICREEMTTETSKKLPCTHIFHLTCLRMWLQRQQTCPTCRANIPSDTQGNTTPAAPPAAPVGGAAEPHPPNAQMPPNQPARTNGSGPEIPNTNRAIPNEQPTSATASTQNTAPGASMPTVSRSQPPARGIVPPPPFPSTLPGFGIAQMPFPMMMPQHAMAGMMGLHQPGMTSGSTQGTIPTSTPNAIPGISMARVPVPAPHFAGLMPGMPLGFGMMHPFPGMVMPMGMQGPYQVQGATVSESSTQDRNPLMQQGPINGGSEIEALQKQMEYLQQQSSLLAQKIREAKENEQSRLAASSTTPSNVVAAAAPVVAPSAAPRTAQPGEETVVEQRIPAAGATGPLSRQEELRQRYVRIYDQQRESKGENEM